MDSTLDLSRWRERPRGLTYRRWAIIMAGLDQELRTRLFRWLLFTAWTGGATIALMGFGFSQAIASGGWLDALATHFGGRTKAIYMIFSGFTALYPEIAIGGFFRLIFWFHSMIGLTLSLVALTAMVPRLLTRDRASNALTLYLSRPLTPADYLIGKFGIIVGVLCLMWTGPLLLGWLLSVVFAPDRDFIVFGLQALKRALIFNAIALGSLSCIALGVSAASRTARHTSLLWIALWLLLGALANPVSSGWIRRASFSYNLAEVRSGIFQLNEVVTGTAEHLPFLSETTTNEVRRLGQLQGAQGFQTALMSLAVMSVLSLVVIFRKLRSE